jgi:hypothetical protein
VILTLLYKIGSFIIRKRYKEPAFVGFRARRPIEALKIVKIVAFFVFLGTLLWFSLVYAVGIEDNFDSYNKTALHGQDDWWYFFGYNSNDLQIQDVVVISGQALGFSTATAFPYDGGAIAKDTKTADISGSLSYKIKSTSTGTYDLGSVSIGVGNGAYATGTALFTQIAILKLDFSNNDVRYYDLSHNPITIKSGIAINTWYNLQIEWDTFTTKCRYQVDVEGWTSWTDCFNNEAFGGDILLDVSRMGTGSVYIDTAGVPPEPEFRIWGINPASSTEITATSTNFTFGYEGFATTTEGFIGWNGILVNFCEEITGICAEEKKYTKAELVGTSGQKTLSFDNFNFDANGHWNLIGDAYFGMFSSDWEWSEGYTGDVVSPDYYVMINFEGLPDIFQVEVPATWYSEHTEYATSTAFFSSVSNILSPLFSKIGEFGSRITGFFDQAEAYSRGKNIGAILPTFKLYIAQFSFLFGGFPIIETFILAMVVMVGFFLFKLVFRIVRG